MKQRIRLTNDIARSFVLQYYQAQYSEPHNLYRFYEETSHYKHGRRDCKGNPTVTAFGRSNIQRAIMDQGFQKCRVEFRSIVALDGLSTVTVLVAGDLLNDGQPVRGFFQTFVLAPRSGVLDNHARKLYILSDVLQYTDEVFKDLYAAPSRVADAIPTTTALKNSLKAEQPGETVASQEVPKDEEAGASTTPGPEAEPASTEVKAGITADSQPADKPVESSHSHDSFSPKENDLPSADPKDEMSGNAEELDKDAVLSSVANEIPTPTAPEKSLEVKEEEVFEDDEARATVCPGPEVDEPASTEVSASNIILDSQPAEQPVGMSLSHNDSLGPEENSRSTNPKVSSAEEEIGTNAVLAPVANAIPTPAAPENNPEVEQLEDVFPKDAETRSTILHPGPEVQTASTEVSSDIMLDSQPAEQPVGMSLSHNDSLVPEENSPSTNPKVCSEEEEIGTNAALAPVANAIPTPTAPENSREVEDVPKDEEVTRATIHPGPDVETAPTELSSEVQQLEEGVVSQVSQEDQEAIATISPGPDEEPTSTEVKAADIMTDTRPVVQCKTMKSVLAVSGGEEAGEADFSNNLSLDNTGVNLDARSVAEKPVASSSPVLHKVPTQASTAPSKAVQKAVSPQFEGKKGGDGAQLFVGNIPVAVGEAELKEFFEQYGTVLAVRIKLAKDGKPNFGFVEFKDYALIQRTINRCIMNRRVKFRSGVYLNVEETYSARLNRAAGAAASPHVRGETSPDSKTVVSGRKLSPTGSLDKTSATHAQHHQLFVGNIHHKVNEAELKKYFETYGTVVSLVIKKGTQKTNFGFLTLNDSETVKKILCSRPVKFPNDWLLNVQEIKNAAPVPHKCTRIVRPEPEAVAQKIRKPSSNPLKSVPSAPVENIPVKSEVGQMEARLASEVDMLQSTDDSEGDWTVVRRKKRQTSR